MLATDPVGRGSAAAHGPSSSYPSKQRIRIEHRSRSSSTQGRRSKIRGGGLEKYGARKQWTI